MSKKRQINEALKEKKIIYKEKVSKLLGVLAKIPKRILFELKKINTEYPILFFTVVIVLVIGFAGFIPMFENEHDINNFYEAIWFVIVTLTTTGYGDISPATGMGKILAVGVMFVGLAFTSILSGIIASVFVERRLREDRGLKELKMKNHIIICGWNHNGINILKSLPIASGNENLNIVLINELGEQDINDLKYKFKDLNIRFVKGNFTSESVLQRANIQEASSAVILSDTAMGITVEEADQKTILGVLAIKNLSPDVKTCAEIQNENNEEHLIRAEVDEITRPGEFAGYLISNAALVPGVVSAVKELLTLTYGNTIRSEYVPKEFIAKTFKDYSDFIYKNKNSILIGFISEERDISLDDILGGDESALDNFIKAKFKEAEEGLLEGSKVKKQVKINPGNDYIIQENDKAIFIG